MATRRKNSKISQHLVRNKIPQKGGGNQNAAELMTMLQKDYSTTLQYEIEESQILYQNAKYYYSASEYAGALVSFACASVLLNTIIRRLKELKAQYEKDSAMSDDEKKSKINTADETIAKAEDVLNCSLISVEELQTIVRNSTTTKKDDDDKPKEWEKICVKIQPLVFKKGSSNCIFYKDVIGLQNQKDQLEYSFVFPLIYPNLFPKVSKGILIYGPPGTGKTLLVKAAVNQLQERSKDVGVLYFTPSPGDLKGKYVGETEKKIEEWFTCASRKACEAQDECTGKKFISIIFIDEIDSIARDRSQDSSGLAANSVNTLLQMMDGINSKENVAIIGATNYPWDLDSAVLRRFDTQILIGMPNTEDIKKLLGYEVNKYLDLKVKLQTVCDDTKNKKSEIEALNNINADKCKMLCEPVEELPHIHDEFIKRFGIEYYEELEKESDPTKLSQVGGIVANLEKESFTNSDISRYVKAAAKRAGELSVKCNLFYNTSLIGDTSSSKSKNENKYMSSLTRIKDKDEAIKVSIKILKSFKDNKIDSSNIYQIDPPKISVVQYNGHNYYNMKCLLYKNNNMIISFPLLKNIFFKGEAIDKEKMTDDEYKENILNEGGGDSKYTDIIMSFNVNFDDKAPPAVSTSGHSGVLPFESQLVTVVYSSLIEVYDADNPNNRSTNAAPVFFNSGVYDDNSIDDGIVTVIGDKFKKININNCSFDFYGFLLLNKEKIKENIDILSSSTSSKDFSIIDYYLLNWSTGKTIENTTYTDITDIDTDDKFEKAEFTLAGNKKIEYYMHTENPKIYINIEDYKKLIDKYYVYENVFLDLLTYSSLDEEEYLEIDSELFYLLFNSKLVLPLSKLKHTDDVRIQLIQLYLNAVSRLINNYDSNSENLVFSDCMLAKFLTIFGGNDINDVFIQSLVQRLKDLEQEHTKLLSSLGATPPSTVPSTSQGQATKTNAPLDPETQALYCSSATGQLNSAVSSTINKVLSVVPGFKGGKKIIKQKGGGANDDIMSEIFKLILQEQWIIDNWYLFYDKADQTKFEDSKLMNASSGAATSSAPKVTQKEVDAAKTAFDAVKATFDPLEKAFITAEKAFNDAKTTEITEFRNYIKQNNNDKNWTDALTILENALNDVDPKAYIDDYKITNNTVSDTTMDILDDSLKKDLNGKTLLVLKQEFDADKKAYDDAKPAYDDAKNNYETKKNQLNPTSISPATFVNEFNTTFNAVYEDIPAATVYEKLYDFYERQESLRNKTNMGDINTKEIFLATSFNFNSVYELKKPNLFSSIGNDISSTYTSFKTWLMNEPRFTTEEAKTARNTKLMNDLMNKNQTISVLFKKITAFGFLFKESETGGTPGFKIESENENSLKQLNKIAWKSIEFGKTIEFFKAVKESIKDPDPTAIRAGILAYCGASYIGPAYNAIYNAGFGLLGATYATLGTGGAVVGAAETYVDVKRSMSIPGGVGTAMGVAAGAALATGTAATVVAAGGTTAAVVAGSYACMLVASNIWKFFSSDKISPEDIINDTFISTFLNIITTIGKFNVDFSKNLLDEVFRNIDKVIKDTSNSIIYSIQKIFNPERWSRSIWQNENITPEVLNITKFTKLEESVNKNIGYSLYNINIPLQAFHYAFLEVKTSYNSQLGKDLIAYNTNKDKFLAEKEARDKKKKNG